MMRFFPSSHPSRRIDATKASRKRVFAGVDRDAPDRMPTRAVVVFACVLESSGAIPAGCWASAQRGQLAAPVLTPRMNSRRFTFTSRGAQRASARPVDHIVAAGANRTNEQVEQRRP